ncbi:IclR family transcriptional regulator [Sphaerisporangium krabiense]|uniref:IclR family acetate operon transcriptional repressor n=1 Tax=Sphaerisporangium krabiense TaxID=763782 RepID=A0A7W9DT30_9ACTN|nr:IclR family transcriptional regulator [Sphaerisporangium krabiense]MBB5629754.1 IclR family acetate operon transcriptional repressor [Sphaerisporangium krabiense]GII63853.1 IclR family transcriptional regulator [Sphaerisporangium krabiense]
MSSERRSDEVGVLVKALDILDRMATDAPCTVAQLCQHTGITKPAAYRILKTLDQRGYVVRDEARKEYSLGPALYGLSRAARNSTDLVRLTRPAMQSLNEEFGETVNLGVVSHGQVVYLDAVESAQRLRTTVQIALRDPVHTTALGKAVLAALPEEHAREQLAQADWSRHTPNAVASVDELLAALGTFRRLGYAIDDEENEVGSRCVAASILDGEGRPVAAISVAAPTSRMPDETMAMVGRRLAEVCAELGNALT